MLEIIKTNPYVIPAILILADIISLPIVIVNILRKNNKGNAVKKIVAFVALLAVIDGIFAFSQISKSTFYDMKGNKYSDVNDVIYYDKDGVQYKFADTDYGKVFKNSNGTRAFSVTRAYIDKDGYLVYISEKLAENKDNKVFTDKDGNTYRLATEVKWDKNGQIKA